MLCTQAWLAVHGPMLRTAAARDSLWARVLSTVGPSTATSAAVSGALPDQEDSPADLLSQQAARSYAAQCAQVCAGQPALYAHRVVLIMMLLGYMLITLNIDHLLMPYTHLQTFPSSWCCSG